MENGENKNLQGRREFFKEAAKKALPIIGAVALISNPVIAKTMQKEPTGCDNDCWNVCTSCRGYCDGGCTNACTGCTGCVGECTGGCKDGCMDTCAAC